MSKKSRIRVAGCGFFAQCPGLEDLCRSAARYLNGPISGGQELFPRLSPSIAQKEMGILPRNRTRSADIPRSPPSASGPPPRDRERLHSAYMPERKPGFRRTCRRSNPNSRWTRGTPANNLAAHMHGTIGLLPSPLPASRAAWVCGAHRITEKIVVWWS